MAVRFRGKQILDASLALAKLANGTAGQLITWAAGGGITTVATGTSGQVLTSNGAGNAPTMQAVGAAAQADFTNAMLMMGG